MSKTSDNTANTTNKMSKETNSLIIKAATSLESLGFNGFILLAESPIEQDANNKLVHMQNIKLNVALNLLSTGIHSLLRNELRSHPEYSKTYKDILSTFLSDYEQIVAKTNYAMEEMSEKNNKDTE